jgi:hypothetical protein
MPRNRPPDDFAARARELIAWVYDPTIPKPERPRKRCSRPEFHRWRDGACRRCGMVKP